MRWCVYWLSVQSADSPHTGHHSQTSQHLHLHLPQYLQSSPPHTLLTWPSPLYDERRELPLIWPLQWVGSQVTGLDRRQTIVFHIQRVRILILVRQERRQSKAGEFIRAVSDCPLRGLSSAPCWRFCYRLAEAINICILDLVREDKPARVDKTRLEYTLWYY